MNCSSKELKIQVKCLKRNVQGLSLNDKNLTLHLYQIQTLSTISGTSQYSQKNTNKIFNLQILIPSNSAINSCTKTKQPDKNLNLISQEHKNLT